MRGRSRAAPGGSQASGEASADKGGSSESGAQGCREQPALQPQVLQGGGSDLPWGWGATRNHILCRPHAGPVREAAAEGTAHSAAAQELQAPGPRPGHPEL